MQQLNFFQYRFFLSYAFFFVLGAFAAINIKKGRDLIVKHGTYIMLTVVLSSVLYALFYYRQLNILHYSISHAVKVVQPSVVLYSTVIVAFFSYLSVLWAKSARAKSLIKTIADISFGIYFIHIMILDFITNQILKYLPHTVPVFIIDAGTILTAFSLSVLFSFLLFKIRFLSWTIGKPRRTQL